MPFISSCNLMSALCIHGIYNTIDDCTIPPYLLAFWRDKTFLFFFTPCSRTTRFLLHELLNLQILKGAEISVHCTDKAVKYSCKKMQGMEWSFCPLFPISLASSFRNSFHNSWRSLLSSAAAGRAEGKDLQMLLLCIHCISSFGFLSLNN